MLLVAPSAKLVDGSGMELAVVAQMMDILVVHIAHAEDDLGPAMVVV